MNLPIRPELFWDVDYAKLNEQTNRRLVIERVFSYGTIPELQSILSFYGLDTIRNELKMAGYLDPKTLFNNQTLIEHLEKNYGFSLQYAHQNTVKGFVDGILIDLLKHDYPYINEPFFHDGVKMLSKEDIAAFKVNAITGSGTRAKDFVDVYFLLKEFSFEEIVGFYKMKYGQRNEFHAIKSLTYFEDLDLSDWPNLVLEKTLTIKKVKETIIFERNKFLRQ